MPVLDALSPPNSKGSSDVIPDLAVVKRPPLPAAVLAAEAADDLLAARVRADVLRDVEDGGVDYDPCTSSKSDEEVSVGRELVKYTDKVSALLHHFS